MSKGLRFTLDLFIPEDPTGTEIAGIKIPSALASKIPAIRQNIRLLKGYARKINEGQPGEEMTVLAVYHICQHGEPGLTMAENCKATEQEI